jgi:hypothetical protein
MDDPAGAVLGVERRDGVEVEPVAGRNVGEGVLLDLEADARQVRRGRCG